MPLQSLLSRTTKNQDMHWHLVDVWNLVFFFLNILFAIIDERQIYLTALYLSAVAEQSSRMK